MVQVDSVEGRVGDQQGTRSTIKVYEQVLS